MRSRCGARALVRSRSRSPSNRRNPTRRGSIPEPMPTDLAAIARELTLGTASYPRQLSDLSKPPASIRVVGELPCLRRAVAIVGTRRADDEALDFAYGLARSLALQGCPIVSGGAVGVDRAAHEGALDAAGSTIVVLPSGLRPPYPSANGPLFDRASREACLLTEVDDGVEPRAGRFLARNRLIAALGRATVVVQAPTRSGALSTAGHARSLGRPVLATPAAPWDPRGAGGLGLILQGARVCIGPNDVLSELALGPIVNAVQRGSSVQKSHDLNGLSAEEARVFQALGQRSRHPDDLCAHTGIPVSDVQRTILRLMVMGLIEERPGGRYRICREERRH